MSDFFEIKQDCVELFLKVSPAASKNRIQGVKDGRLRVQIAAAPEDGKANAALTAFLAKKLALPKSAVTIKSGEKSRAKTVLLPAGCPAASLLNAPAMPK